ncbi:SEC-C metal-binding domain-containing protein [Hathewaya histolytica]|uniref:Preprotein translocase subunit SecA (ATPase, RNA helicase) n=1 Tax=Hathewaya histolytica TaxID=1498 RepID=A0A4U9S3D7_HATHI|nr:SEC-C metal-binding domain-containing protein [Hathewaya histolytica]VTQ96180.1 preprotein translocase subunit SecA (ATPase, RNA helicase) [Hathewaya histolytica]
MSLYKQWTDSVVEYVKTKGEAAFWREYGEVETKFYSKLLSNRTLKLEGKLEDLAKEYEVSVIHFMGILDGLNESFKEELDLEKIEQTSEINSELDFEKLYFNMLDAKADYLYGLPQWEGIFSKEKRREIQKAYRDSKTVVKEVKIGRNDPCPCGSGKKYKKCCGKGE